MSDIDIVIPYVDSSDVEWQKLFTQYNPNKNTEIEGVNARNRFRGQGDFFRFWFRCVSKNLPYIRKIHLIVQSESQIPKWIDRDKVHIVYHSDIIPEKYLPTFNSTCIEMFLWKIEDLSEQFLYANDDFYVTKYIAPENFFKNDLVYRQPAVRYTEDNSMYGSHCMNSFCLPNGLDRTQKISYYVRFRHCIRPYLKSSMIECYNKYEKEILDSLSKFREKKNYNVYLFDNYLITCNKVFQAGSHIQVGCIDAKMSKVEKLRALETSSLVAIQDTAVDDRDIYKDSSLLNWFGSKYSSSCKYENDKYNFLINREVASKEAQLISQYEWYQLAIFKGWCSRAEYNEFMKSLK